MIDLNNLKRLTLGLISTPEPDFIDQFKQTKGAKHNKEMPTMSYAQIVNGVLLISAQQTIVLKALVLLEQVNETGPKSGQICLANFLRDKTTHCCVIPCTYSDLFYTFWLDLNSFQVTLLLILGQMFTDSGSNFHSFWVTFSLILGQIVSHSGSEL